MVGFRDEVAAAGPTAEITLGEGVVLGLDLDVVAEGAKAEVIASKDIKDPTTAGYSPEDKAKVEALAALPTKEPGRLDLAASCSSPSRDAGCPSRSRRPG